MNRLRLVLLLTLACTSAAPLQKPTQDPAPLQPPIARKEPKDVSVHGDKRIDDYFWLRNKGTPEVEQYLLAETAYADAVMAPTAQLQKTLYEEMLSRIQETDQQVPFLRDGHYYYSRTEKGKQYPILCRRKGSPAAPEQVILDLNLLAEGKKFLGLGGWTSSDDGSLLAYSTDETGFRQFDLQVKDLSSGKTGPERIERVDSFAWGRDGKSLFYVTEDAQTKRANQLWRHILGASKDDLMYEEKDEMFGVQVERSRSRDFIFVTSASHTATEVRFFGASDPYANLLVVQPREKDHEYYLDHRGGLFYIRTNSGGRNFRLVTAPVFAPRKENWTELVPHRDDVLIVDFDVFKDFLVRYERAEGLPQFSITRLANGETRRVAFPEADYQVSPEHNAEFDQKAYRINYQSFVTPPSVYDVDMATHEQTLLKRQPVPNYDPSRYQVERLWAPAADGVKVPVALVHKKGLVKDGKSALYLYGYGSYGLAMPDTFSSDRFSLVDRGVTYAIAHIRGGSELGKKWHDAGRMMNKKNTFTDFIACAEFLIKQGYTSPARLAISGGSAGGLLMGAVLNMRPDLFHVAMVYVPFVDVVNTMLDETLPLTVAEFEEWGNPKKPDEYSYIRSYSPYDNVEAKAYPTIFVRSSYNDSQVMYWEPAKWVAKLRATKTDGNPLLFKVNMEPAGHRGASGRYDRLRDVAYDYAFLLGQLGAQRNPAGA
jgi:oligopeptidase B